MSCLNRLFTTIHVITVNKFTVEYCSNNRFLKIHLQQFIVLLILVQLILYLIQLI